MSIKKFFGDMNVSTIEADTRWRSLKKKCTETFRKIEVKHLRLKKRLHHRRFSVNLSKFFAAAIPENICEHFTECCNKHVQSEQLKQKNVVKWYLT